MNEYEHMIERNYEPYSQAHRAMYHVVVELLRDKPADILEIGTGIGYGIEVLEKANCISHYVGVENDKQTLEYVQKKFPHYRIEEKLSFFPIVHFSLFIETIEHMSYQEAMDYLYNIKQHTKHALFLSTPDKERDEHGIYTKGEIIRMVTKAGFQNVVALEWQLPHTLFICT